MKSPKLFKKSFDRDFQLWFYTPSHSCLLLRANRATGHPTRIDIGFHAVGSLSVDTLMKSLSVEEVDEEEARRLGIISQDDKPVSYHKFFVLRSGQWTGHMVAAGIQWIEDGGSYSDPSSLASFP